MLNDTNFDYLSGFYGNSAKWFAIYILIVSIFTISSNAFFIIFTLTTKSLRANSTNWLLLGFSISELLYSTAQLFNAHAHWYGSIENRQLCAVAGMLVINTAISSYGYPAMIAADRYYKINTIPQSTGLSIGRAIFSKRRIIPLMVVWYFLSIIIALPYTLNNIWGEDPAGFCGAKKFASIPLMLSYECTVILVFVGWMITTIIYYYRLVRWIKQQQALVRRASVRRRSNISNKDSEDYTSGVMRVMTIVTLLPLITIIPVQILTMGQMVLPVIPMWINRLLISPYYFSGAANPWLTISLIRQFRVRFLQLVSNAKNTISRAIYGLINRSSNVQKI